jgi:hypothetical protein
LSKMQQENRTYEFVQFCQKWGDKYGKQIRGAVDLNFDRVKQVVENVDWSPMNEIYETEHVTQATITETEPAGGALGQAHGSQMGVDSITVTIHDGLIKGLGKSLKVPVIPPQVKTHFGSYIEFDPSNAKPLVRHNGMKLDMGMEHNLGPGGSTAEIRCKTKEYAGIFQANISLQGLVLMKDGDTTIQQELYEIMTDLKEWYGLEQVGIRGKKVILQMTGRAVFRWESDHSLSWHQQR